MIIFSYWAASECTDCGCPKWLISVYYNKHEQQIKKQIYNP